MNSHPKRPLTHELTASRNVFKHKTKLLWLVLVVPREKCGILRRVDGTGDDNGWWISEKCLILTYCRRNVSVGRVIGIHIGRVMGGREHSVVVDSESWTKTTERDSDSHLEKHITEETVMERQQEGRGTQVWDRVMLSWAVTSHIVLRSIPDPSTNHRHRDNMAANVTAHLINNQHYKSSLCFDPEVCLCACFDVKSVMYGEKCDRA